MAKAVRPVKRLFNSPVSNVAAWALQDLAPEQFVDPKEIHWMVLRNWRTAVDRWYREYDTFWTPSQWNFMKGCDTSLLWTPRLVAKRGQRPQARFCHQRWLCPFCYGREIVAFLRPFESRTFQMYRVEFQAYNPETIWSRFLEISTDLHRRYGAVASWRYAHRCTDIWVGGGLWLYPGQFTLSELETELVKALAYPYGVLSTSMEYLVSYLNFMGSHRGRELSGEYRRENRQSVGQTRYRRGAVR